MLEDSRLTETGSLCSWLEEKASDCSWELLGIEWKVMAGPAVLMEPEVGNIAGHWVEGEAQKMKMRMKMENHMEKASVAKSCCSHQPCVLALVGTQGVDRHRSVGYVVAQVMMLNRC